MNRSSGFFITLDGPSGVGKTTVGGLLAEILGQQGLQVTLTSEPSPSEIGNLARYGTYEYRGLTLSLLIAADRYHHTETIISPALQRGHVVICDRYIPSSMVLDQLDGVDPAFVQTVYRYLPRPDLAVFLAADPMVCRARAAERGNHSRFQNTSIEGSKAEAALFKAIGLQLAKQCYPVLHVDLAGRTAAQIAAALADRFTSSSIGQEERGSLGIASEG
jgi:dTMP kinase